MNDTFGTEIIGKMTQSFGQSNIPVQNVSTVHPCRNPYESSETGADANAVAVVNNNHQLRLNVLDTTRSPLIYIGFILNMFINPNEAKCTFVVTKLDDTSHIIYGSSEFTMSELTDKTIDEIINNMIEKCENYL